MFIDRWSEMDTIINNASWEVGTVYFFSIIVCWFLEKINS